MATRTSAFHFVFVSYFAVVPIVQFQKQRILRATISRPSIFAEGDYRRVRLTHPNWLVKYCWQESYPYVQAPGFYLSRLMVTHRNTKINVYAIARTAQKLRGRCNDKARDDGIYYRASEGTKVRAFKNRDTFRVAHTSNTSNIGNVV